MTEYITLALAGIAAVLSLICVLIRPKQGATLRDLQNLSQELQEEMRALRTEVGGTIHGTLQSTAELQANAQRQVAEAQNTRLRELSGRHTRKGTEWPISWGGALSRRIGRRSRVPWRKSGTATDPKGSPTQDGRAHQRIERVWPRRTASSRSKAR